MIRAGDKDMDGSEEHSGPNAAFRIKIYYFIFSFTMPLFVRIIIKVDKTNKNHILSILLGFTTQFTDYFAQRIKKFLKPRYVDAQF